MHGILPFDVDLPEFEPTPAAARACVDAINPQRYARTRNHIDGAVTRLSPYLTHGFIDVPQVIARLSQRCVVDADDKIVFELAWREYFHHLWRHWGDAIFEARQPAPAARYADRMPADLRQGRTGVPAVDRAVRALYDTGYLHNHARMWLASYTVHLRKVDWRAGAAWMYAHLLDGDLASNTLSWQWVAGTLTGKPYLFNSDNVERHAPQWASPGTAIDDGYDALDRRAREAADCGPEAGTHAAVTEPRSGDIPDPDGWRTGIRGDVWIMHPWSLGEPPPGHVIGWIEPSFHQRFPWSERRWAFVLERMRARCDALIVGDAAVLRRALPGTRLTAMRTFNPGYAQALRGAGAMLEPVARQFADPPTPMASFSRFWQAVAPASAMVRPWHR